ncbi:MAG TPA: hypothetical protein VGW79_08150 [Actinomycetota bacterium]|nr:hypothetical protein [Actinomycetota bacterium]
MATARELLEQADALMRRNRGNRGDGDDGVNGNSGDDSIPILTESIENALGGPSLRGPSTREGAGALHAPLPTAEGIGAPGVAANAPDANEPPLLTDAVEEVAVDLLPLQGGKPEEDSDPWLGPDTIDPTLHSITGPSPDTVEAVPSIALRAVPSTPSPSPAALEVELDESIAAQTFRAAGSATTPPPAGSMPAESEAAAEAAADVAIGTIEEERWRALAEQISMQVLQRLDLFVDTGLKVQLAAHLQPIVARAGTELVEAINDHVGQLVRSYIAEAIEREIAQWRQGQP